MSLARNVVTVGSATLFSRLLGVARDMGIAIAIAVSGWASAGLLGALIAQRIGFGIDAQARDRLPRIVLAAAIMGLVVEAAHRVLQPWLGASAHGIVRAAVLAALITFGLGVYIVLLRALTVTSPRDFMRAVGRGL